jgi:hypothetical protein
MRMTSDFFPGLGSIHVVSMSGVGHHAIETTVGANTALTAALWVAVPPNTLTGMNAPVVIVHSLGAPPSMVIPIPMYTANANSIGGVNYHYLTANASAVYLMARTFTGGPLGIATRIHVVR